MSRTSNGGLSAADITLESHEDRIQRLEDTSTATREDIVKARADIGHLVGQVSGLEDKIDTLKDAMETHANESKENFGRVLGRVTVIEADKADAEAALKRVKSVLFPVFVAVLTAIATKYGQAIFDWLNA